MTPLGQRLAREIEATGPMPVARYMAECLAHYYGTRDPLGRGGDFTTAPEISQIFGELIGLWLADLWLRAGSPPKVRLVELGPGRGTLMADIRRATARVPGFHAATKVHLVETSPSLRAEQAARMPDAIWHHRIDELPDDAPLLLVANEFFDALPIRQLIRTPAGWRERMVAHGDGGFFEAAGPTPLDALVPAALAGAPEGATVELMPMATAIAAEIGARLAAQGGAALIVDYGYAGPSTGDTLQAVKDHAFTDPFADPGEADLTAHVDFTALAAAAAPARAWKLTTQGNLLAALGIAARTEALAARASPEQAALLRSGTDRLVLPDAMGSLFKALALTGRDWPQPAGFE
ncbi:class I SAM-dependent methyltransferase [Sphingoaurantiacus capsulatus]|uniref:Class I SAM-dependent methyltransferase n=1 Tax=Sphingoaurantiacus capsulatus TaxID=1771310 RepID=A0ABV7XAX1_9SPHN